MVAIVTALSIAPYVDDLPDLDPIIAHERTDYGWRGLTEQGEVLEVRGSNGHAIEVPSEIIVAQNNRPIGRRAVSERTADIDDYLAHFNQGIAHYRANRFDEALQESDAALKMAPTFRARFNRSWVLLSAGRWPEGFAEYWQCEQHAPFMRPQAQAALCVGIPAWNGEDLRGKRLLLLHAHGFGDTIMMLRYLPTLQAMGAEVVVKMPPALARLWPIGMRSLADGADYFCPILHLLHFLYVTPESVDGSPYLTVHGALSERWRSQLGTGRRRVGVAWSVGKPSDGDYPREIPLAELVAALGDAEIHSVQLQGAEEARQLGVHVHAFDDFADCAGLMLQMDEIVSVDTAALHLAGAIGHPRVFGLLSHWASWRWLAPWYDNLTLCRQATAGDWSSALAEIHTSRVEKSDADQARKR